METETIDSAAQMPQPSARNHQRIVGNQRGMKHPKVTREFSRTGIRLCCTDGRAAGFDVQLERCRRKPRINSRNRQTIRLAATMRRRIRRLLCQRAQFRRHICQMSCERQLRSQLMQFGKIKAKDASGMQIERAAHHLSRYKWIAVAVAADPATHLQKGCKSWGIVCLNRGAAFRRQPVLQRTMQPGHLPQECVIVERQPIGDFIEDRELGPAQKIGLPERHHGTAQLLVARRKFIRGHLGSLPYVKNGSDLHFTVDRALAANLGGMSRENRAYLRLGEEDTQCIGANSRIPGTGQSARQDSGVRHHLLRAALADIVLVFGDIGKMREITECTNNTKSIGDRHSVENAFELLTRRLVIIAMEANRSLPNAFDQIEHLGPFLIANGVTQDAPETPDVRTQQRIIVRQRNITVAKSRVASSG